MAAEEHFRALEDHYHAARTNEYYRPRLTVSKGGAEVRIDARPDFFHAMNAVHGSVYFKLLDDAAFFAANSVVPDVFLLTVTFNVVFARPVTGGEMVARGRLIQHSRRMLSAEAVLVDGRGRELARGTGTFMKSSHPIGD
jgi:uncharacterized protein (TIGR00369 family)